MDHQGSILPISHELKTSISLYKRPENLGFGSSIAPIMLMSKFTKGRWQEPQIQPYGPIPMAPAAKVFHYGQQIFEGMKAFRRNDQDPFLFRPKENYDRFVRSARRMCMPEVPENLFMSSLKTLVHYLTPIIPQRENESLYLRPMMIATESGLSLKSSGDYLFLIIAAPSAEYFSSAKVRALIEREDCRASPGGTGAFKVGGNYGASIQSGVKANALGFQQTLWLDARQQRYIEEFSGMNFFAVVNGELWTPELTDTILPGITRDSIIKMARHKGMIVREFPIDIDELLNLVSKNICREIFACGTAAVVTPISELGESTGTTYRLAESFGEVTQKLSETIRSIQQTGKCEQFDWVMPIARDQGDGHLSASNEPQNSMIAAY